MSSMFCFQCQKDLPLNCFSHAERKEEEPVSPHPSLKLGLGDCR